ncbi:DNA polymerase eta [Crucibulum laeve]|uniref:DNA polymerase eta n=1 Tax=Crucibulum laeve TaxID=68775 RepID=A0A5C3M4M1_9AGAR|nr:DNA polymerase eta [Crucibulum laeve]
MDPRSPTRPTALWKGKAKATEDSEDFNDLNPVITYRHAVAQNLGIRDPLRVVALCDSDAFYAACEMVRLGVDKETPLVVLQWEMLIAVNYPARKFGISRMDKLKDAKKRCPHLKVVHVATYKEGEKEPGYWDNVDTNTHKVSLDYYRRESSKIAGMFKDGLPGCEVEKASIDEAFIDFTKPAREILLQRYPHLAQVPPNGMDTPLPPPPPIVWDELGELIPIEHVVTDNENKEDSARNTKAPSTSEAPTTWHDVMLSIAAGLMEKAREEVRVKLGYTTSAGIARNKFLAKLSASYKKPNSQSILRNIAIPNYLRPLKFQKIRFLGGKLGGALAQEYDASTVGDLLAVGLEELQRKFGEESLWIYEVLRGVDRTEVKDKGSTLNKSMLASKNLPKPITKASEGHHWIRVLAAELALRLNDARDVSPNLWPKTIVLHARKGYESGRSKQAPFPFTREVTVDVIASAGDKLWKELVGNSLTMNVSSVQLAFTGIDVAEPGQRTIEGFLKTGYTNKRVRDGSNAEDVNEQHSGSAGAVTGDTGTQTIREGEDQSMTGIPSYNCPRCSRTFRLPESTPEIAIVQEETLAAIRMEHDDFHFAQDLARSSQPNKVLTVKTPEQKPRPTKKRRKDSEGIEKFFSRK